MATPEDIKVAQQLANEAIAEGNDLTRQYGELLRDSLKDAERLGVVQKANASILTRQLAAEKAKLSEDVKRKNLTRQISYLKLQASKYDEMGHDAISRQLNVLIKGLKTEEDNLDVLKEKNKIFDLLIEKAKDLRNKLTLAAIFTGLVGVASKFGERIDKIGESFGSLNVLGDGFQKNLLESSVEATKLGGGLDDVAAITSALASDFGVSVDSAAKLSGKVFDTSKAIGLSAEEGANLFGTLMQTADLSAEQAESLAEGAFQLARQEGVAPASVLKDISESTEEIASFTRDGGDNIAEAAVQARKLGVSLSTTAKIAEGLLDFESSIASEVEASVLIGRQLNFQKARELALNNDIAGAVKSVVDQLGSEEEFNKLNFIQRKALADSINVSVAQMSKLVGQSDKLSLSGAMAAGNFEDLLGDEGISNISKVVNQFKSLGATLVNELGPTLEKIIGQFSDFLTKGGGIEKITGAIQMMASGFSTIMNFLPAVIGGIAALKTVQAGLGLKLLFPALAKSATFGGAVGVAATVAAIAAGMVSLKAMAVDDFKSGPGGINFMSGPAGAFTLNPRDSVLATTNPIRVNDMVSTSAPMAAAPPTEQKQTIVLSARVRGRDLVFLGDRPNAGGDAGYEGLA